MWSFGCILVELYTGEPLFDGSSETDQLYKLIEVLGMPPQYLLDTATKTKKFFDYRDRTWQLKETYYKNYVSPGSKELSDILSEQHPDTFKPTHQNNDDIETQRGMFISLIRRLLEYDPRMRIKPYFAINHPFMQRTQDKNISTKIKSPTPSKQLPNEGEMQYSQPVTKTGPNVLSDLFNQRVNMGGKDAMSDSFSPKYLNRSEKMGKALEKFEISTYFIQKNLQ